MSKSSWISQSLAASLPMDQHKETEHEENGILWQKTGQIYKYVEYVNV